MRERLAFPFEVKELTDPGQFTGYASVFGNEDLQGDVVMPGAFTKTIAERPQVPILWSHDPFELPLGTSIDMAEDQVGLKVVGRLNLDTQRGREVHALLRQGALRGLSIGYAAVKQGFEAGVRLLREIKLYEFSLCVFPANELATVGQVKDAASLQAAMAWAGAEMKAGRVLSSANRELVAQAIGALQALLAAAEPADATPPPEGAAAPPLAEPVDPATLRAFLNHTKAMEVLAT